MGVSTNANLCYGISFEEDYEFPWSDYDEGIEGWWLETQGYKPPFELFNAAGNYIDGIKPSQEKISEYFAAQREFQKANPLPIEEIMHCSGDYPMYILATVSSPKTARRGYPETIDNLDVVEAEKDVLLRFCEQWELEGEGPAWWLSSLWF